MTAALVTMAVAVVVLFVVPKCIGRVPADFAGVVERRGTYHRTLGPGVHPLIGFLERLRRVDLRPQRLELPSQPVITADDLVVDIELTIEYQVVDPARATYEIANYVTGLEQLAITSLRGRVGQIPAADVRTSQRQIADELLWMLGQSVGRWGLRVDRVSRLEIAGPKRAG